MVPKAVLMRSGLVSINIVRQNISKTTVLVNTARQVNTAHSKLTLNATRPMGKEVNTGRSKVVVNVVKGYNVNAIKASACWVWKLKTKVLDCVLNTTGNLQMDLQDQGVIDSGCSRHMTGNMSYLTDYEEIDGGYVAFGGNPKGGKITGKCTIKTVPRKNNMYIVDLKNIVPKGGLTCLFAKSTSDKSKLWHRRLGHINFKTINKLVKGNLIRDLPSKRFENDQTCVACQKGKQHRASCKSKTTADTSFSQSSKSSQDDGSKPSSDDKKRVDEDPRKDSKSIDPEKDDNVNTTNNVNAASINEVNVVGEKTSIELPDDPNMPALEDYSIFDLSSDDQDNGAEADMNKLDTTIQVSPILTTRVPKDHPVEQIIRDLNSTPQTRRMAKNMDEHVEPKKVIQALQDPSWIEAMQDELLQFKLQKVWTLVDFPNSERPIGTKWVFRNKKDKRGIMIKNKQDWFQDGCQEFFSLWCKPVQEPIQPKGSYHHAVKRIISYKPSKRKKIIVTEASVRRDLQLNRRRKVGFVGFRSFYNLVLLLIQVTTAISTMQEVVRFKASDVVVTVLDRRWHWFGRGDAEVKQKEDGIFISQDNYVVEILKIDSTPIKTQKPLTKDEEAADVDVHLYRSMIGSLMYLTASRTDIMFAVYACSRVSSFDLEAYSDSDYARANLDRKSTTGEVEYVAAANCCGQVLWIQNQMLDYGFNFMNTKIYTDNESTIFIVKNPVFHSKTKHIEIRHHLIRDAYEKKLIQVLQIHTDDNVADLLTKAFDVSRFNFLTVNIGMLNL
ncbi:copia protein [Tanacetum coccineum]